MDLYFLTYEDVTSIHTDQIKRYGGKTGLRDENLLLSAIATTSKRFRRPVPAQYNLRQSSSLPFPHLSEPSLS